jgi:integrase
MSFSGQWRHIAKAAGLPNEVTPHTLRHSFASLAGDLGYSDPIIAALIGHEGRTTTSLYVQPGYAGRGRYGRPTKP